MIHHNSGKLPIVVMFVVLIALVSCIPTPPRFNSKGVDIDDSDAQLYDNIGGTYASLGEIEDISATVDIKEKCTPGVVSYPGKKETLTFEQNNLFVADENGQRAYTMQNFGQFCRELDSGNIECIEQITHDGETSSGYVLNVYESKNNLELCFTGFMSHDPVTQPSIAGSQQEENAASEIEAEDIAENGEQAAEPPFDVSTCWPNPADYTLEIINLSDDITPGGKHSCNADGTITNHSDRELMFAVYRINHYGNEITFGEKWRVGYQSLQPGETAEYGGFHRCTGGNCKEGEWFYIQRLSVMYGDRECFAFNNSFEDKAPESIVSIENPCDW